MGVPVLVTAIVITFCIALAVAVSGVVYRGSRAAGRGARSAAGLAGTALVAQLAWLAITATIAGSGIYATDPWLGVGFAVPLLLGLLALRVPAVATGLADPGRLAALQVLRVVGGTFLVLMELHQLPPSFAVSAGGGDVLVGLLAPWVAYALWRRPDRRGAGIAFNVLGLLDLVVALPLGLFHAPGRLQLIVTDPTTELVGLLPMALIPTFFVPIAFVLHLRSLRLLSRKPAAVG